MPILRSKKVNINAVEVVDIALVLNTVLAAGISDEKFKNRVTEKIKLLRKEYEEQIPIDDRAAIAKKILRRYKVKS